MKHNIQEIESGLNSDYKISLWIQNVRNEEQATTLAEEWCDKNNSLMVGKPEIDMQLSTDDTPLYTVKVISDDYI